MNQETLFLLVSLIATGIGVLFNTIRSDRRTRAAVEQAQPGILARAAVQADQSAKTQVASARDVLAEIARERFDELETKNAESLKLIEALNTQTDELRLRIKTGDEARVTLEASLKLSQQEIVKLRGEIDELRRDNQIVRSERDIEARHAEQLEHELAETKLKLAAAEAKLEAAEKQIERLETEMERLKIERSAYQQFLDRIQVHVEQIGQPVNGALPTTESPDSTPAKA